MPTFNLMLDTGSIKFYAGYRLYQVLCWIPAQSSFMLDTGSIKFYAGYMLYQVLCWIQAQSSFMLDTGLIKFYAAYRLYQVLTGYQLYQVLCWIPALSSFIKALHAGKFCILICCLLFFLFCFFHNQLFVKFLYHQSVNQFGSKSVPTCRRP